MDRTKKCAALLTLICTLNLTLGCAQHVLHPLTPVRLASDVPFAKVAVLNPDTGEWQIVPGWHRLHAGQTVYWEGTPPVAFEQFKGELVNPFKDGG